MNNYYLMLLSTLFLVFVTMPMNNDTESMDSSQLSSTTVSKVDPDEQLSRTINELEQDIERYSKVSETDLIRITLYQDLNAIAKILKNTPTLGKDTDKWKQAINTLKRQDLAFIRKMINNGLAYGEHKADYNPTKLYFKDFIDLYAPNIHTVLNKIAKHNKSLSPSIHQERKELCKKLGITPNVLNSKNKRTIAQAQRQSEIIKKHKKTITDDSKIIESLYPNPDSYARKFLDGDYNRIITISEEHKNLIYQRNKLIKDNKEIKKIDNQINSVNLENQLKKITTELEAYPKFLTDSHNQLTINAIDKERHMKGETSLQEYWAARKKILDEEKETLLTELSDNKKLLPNNPEALIESRNSLYEKRKQTIKKIDGIKTIDENIQNEKNNLKPSKDNLLKKLQDHNKKELKKWNKWSKWHKRLAPIKEAIIVSNKYPRNHE